MRRWRRQVKPMSDHQPVALSKSENRELEIRWSDGLHQQIPFRALRDACQCATCMEKKVGKSNEPVGTLQILSAAETMLLDIASMKPVGNYAYNIQFSDGHSTGIFTFDLLRSLQ